jgi:hypothetical protein
MGVPPNIFTCASSGILRHDAAIHPNSVLDGDSTP